MITDSEFLTGSKLPNKIVIQHPAGIALSNWEHFAMLVARNARRRIK